MRLKSAHLPLITAFTAFLAACSPGTGTFTRCQGEIWHTAYHITYRGPEHLADSIIPVLEKVGKSVSVFDPHSVVSRINRGETDSTDSYFRTVYNTSCKIAEASGHAFDPTVEPLVAAWGFGRYTAPTADTARIDSLLSFVGINRTALEGARLAKEKNGIRFDFSAIAKGFGVDEVARMLRRNGVSDYLVEIGGEISTGGTSPSGKKWTISIDRPVADKKGEHHESACVIEMTDMSLATSGNYRNFIDLGMRRIAHTISPSTGRPVQTDVISATVLATDCMEADAFATACMALPSAEAREMLSARNLAGMLILNNGTVVTTGGFDHLIRKQSRD